MKRRLLLSVVLAGLGFGLWGCDSGEKTRTVEYTAMTCTEILYHGTDSLEFVELKAAGTPLSSMSAVNLRLEGAVYYAFPDEPLDTGEYIVVTNDTALFREHYPDFSGRLFGPWYEDEDETAVGRLSNSGDVIEIKLDGSGDFDGRYDDDPPWPSRADGGGSSLVYIGDSPAYAESWAASKTDGGNPGSGDDPVYASLTVRVNEVMPYGNGDSCWLELYNSGSEDVDVGGWQIYRAVASDSLRVIAAGSSVPAGGYLVITRDASDSVFYFTARGEDIYLREVDADGDLTGSESGLQYSAVPDGKSAGVVSFSDGSLEQGTLSSPTPGAENGTLSLGPLYISEIYYNPPDGAVEFLELVNKSDTSVTWMGVVDTKLVSWKVEGVGTTSSRVITIAPGGIVLLLPTTYTSSSGGSVTLDTTWYREEAKLDTSVTILQYSGKLSNRGELIAVKQPVGYVTDLTEDDGIKWYYQWSDAILYSDGGSWPSEADGGGKSLQRTDFSLAGYEPGAWEAATPTPGVL